MFNELNVHKVGITQALVTMRKDRQQVRQQRQQHLVSLI
jgi:hypothetical protein